MSLPSSIPRHLPRLALQFTHRVPSTTRTLFGFGRSKPSKPDAPFKPASAPAPLLTQDNLFHPLLSSPIPALRSLGERIASKGKCPVSGRTPLAYTCPISGYPTHASREDWEKDETHREVYAPRLREVNEDEHDLRSGREMREFEMPREQPQDETPSLQSWDVLLYTRNFFSVDNLRSRRHLSRLLSYPMTIAGVLHELGPYAVRAGGRVSAEGERSLLALRYMLHKAPSPSAPPPPAIRIFLPGARAESTLPSHIWSQLAYLFPHARFHIYFVGPEVILPPSTPILPLYGVPGRTEAVDGQVSLTTIKAPWEQVHDSFGPFDPFTDAFFVFHPGLGFPSITHPGERQVAGEWGTALPQMLASKCPVFLTAFSPTDMQRDVQALGESKHEGVEGEWEMVIEPGDNVFSSLKWEVAEFDTRVMVRSNWGVWGIRGRRYEVQAQQTD